MPWVKGQTGNAGGRPKAASMLARLARSKTKQGEDLVDFALTVLRDASAEMADRIDMLKWLADRGWGKAVETVVIEEERPPDFVPPSLPQLEAIAGTPDGHLQ